MGHSYQPSLFYELETTAQIMARADQGWKHFVAEALNHNPRAAAMYRANHPFTRVWVQEIEGIPPEVVAAGRRIGLAWFSPDCTFHSKARGSAPIRKEDEPIRDLPEVVIDWAKRVRPRVIMLENVEEIVKWGPLDESGKRIKHLEGMFWNAWVAALRELGYQVEWKELRGCDYGAPTSRKRLFVIARCDGKPIVWPKPTHGDGYSLQPYRSAAECLDWDRPVQSIFDRDEPFVPATCKRLARGVVKYVLEEPEPFLAPVSFPNAANRADRIAAWMVQHNENARGFMVTKPMTTLTTKPQQQLVTASFISVYRRNSVGLKMTQPLNTVTSGGDRGGGHFAHVAAAFLAVYNGTDQSPEMRAPMPTVVGNDRFGLVTAHIDGELRILTDIGMRFLTPRECYRAQGFLDSYIIDPMYDGRPLSETAQMKCCGNSVNPQIAEALVAANVVLEDDEIVTDAFAGGGGATVGMLKGLNDPQEVYVKQRAAA
ncbi:hypothetical protein ABS71_10670 [bacterium SCN 62-11]|nr:MAG: hypothetical protein ABS71_10670 [bacterium SCN 62-11]